MCLFQLAEEVKKKDLTWEGDQQSSGLLRRETGRFFDFILNFSRVNSNAIFNS